MWYSTIMIGIAVLSGVNDSLVNDPIDISRLGWFSRIEVTYSRNFNASPVSRGSRQFHCKPIFWAVKKRHVNPKKTLDSSVLLFKQCWTCSTVVRHFFYLLDSIVYWFFFLFFFFHHWQLQITDRSCNSCWTWDRGSIERKFIDQYTGRNHYESAGELGTPNNCAMQNTPCKIWKAVFLP